MLSSLLESHSSQKPDTIAIEGRKNELLSQQIESDREAAENLLSLFKGSAGTSLSNSNLESLNASLGLPKKVDAPPPVTIDLTSILKDSSSFVTHALPLATLPSQASEPLETLTPPNTQRAENSTDKVFAEPLMQDSSQLSSAQVAINIVGSLEGTQMPSDVLPDVIQSLPMVSEPSVLSSNPDTRTVLVDQDLNLVAGISASRGPIDNTLTELPTVHYQTADPASSGIPGNESSSPNVFTPSGNIVDPNPSAAAIAKTSGNLSSMAAADATQRSARDLADSSDNLNSAFTFESDTRLVGSDGLSKDSRSYVCSPDPFSITDALPVTTGLASSKCEVESFVPTQTSAPQITTKELFIEPAVGTLGSSSFGQDPHRIDPVHRPAPGPFPFPSIVSLPPLETVHRRATAEDRASSFDRAAVLSHVKPLSSCSGESLYESARLNSEMQLLPISGLQQVRTLTSHS